MPKSQHRLHPVLDYWGGLDRKAPVQERCYSINICNSTPHVFASREKSLLLAPKQDPAFTSISRRCLVHSSEYHFLFFFLKQKYWGNFKFSSKPLLQAPSDSWCNTGRGHWLPWLITDDRQYLPSSSNKDTVLPKDQTISIQKKKAARDYRQEAGIFILLLGSHKIGGVKSRL